MISLGQDGRESTEHKELTLHTSNFGLIPIMAKLSQSTVTLRRAFFNICGMNQMLSILRMGQGCESKNGNRGERKRTIWSVLKMKRIQILVDVHWQILVSKENTLVQSLFLENKNYCLLQSKPGDRESQHSQCIKGKENSVAVLHVLEGIS